MTYTSAVQVFAGATRDAEHAASVLCAFATIANMTGQYQRRDDNVETAADLIEHSRRFSRCLRSESEIARLPC